MALAATTAATASPSLAAQDTRPAAKAPALHHGKLQPGAKAFTNPLTVADGRQSVLVELAGASGADVASRGGSVSALRAQVARAAEGALASARSADKRATQIFTISNALPGVGLKTTAAGVRALLANDDVVSVTRIATQSPSNANVASLVKAVDTWKYAGNTGKGVKVGIIDTGLDYTHADFGGVGTVEAYQAALASDTDPGWRAALPKKAKAKIIGGHDFVGDDYNADPTSASYQPVPKPDENPLDCNEHGTHVAGTAAGYGVGGNGKVFSGKYKKLNKSKLLKMDIGPGMAPEAQLYPLRVFGCDGSTDVTIAALDWALDPNGDGNFKDHLDIVNLSLGSDYGNEDSADNKVVDALARHGVLSVIAMGNAGDITDIGGEPGNATSSLAVASTVDALQQRDGIKVNAPSGVAGIAAGQMSVAYDWPNNGPTGQPVTGTVATIPGANADGCSPLSASDAAKVAGKVAWLEWDDNDATRRCGSVGRSANVKNAGAIGAVFTSGLNVFGAGITGDTQIPVFQLPKVGTDKLRPAAEAGTLNVTFDGALQATIKDVTPSISDTLSSFSSRGTHGSINSVKPDVAAPGDTVSSAGVGTGNKVLTISGTSMATPVTAGVAALVKAAHPKWSPLLVKAAVMNTAGHDVYTEPNHKGKRYAPARVGSGRIDARAASATKVLAYTKGKNNPVSASFGVVPVPVNGGKVTKTKKVKIKNVGKKTQTIKLAYQAVNTSPGAKYSVSPKSVTIKKGKAKTVKVTLTVDPKALRHTIDPTMATTQTNVYYDQDQARQYVTDASGRLLVKPGKKAALRVPVYAAPKPVSVTKATAGATGVDLAGAGVKQGSDSTAYTSLVSVLELGATSPKLPTCTDTVTTGCATTRTERAGDLQYVGAVRTGTGQDSLLTFGLSTYADWVDVGTVNVPFVDYDVDGDQTPDFETYIQPIADTDLLYAWTVDLASGDLVDLEPVNQLLGDTDTNVFDNNVVTMPVYLDALGVPTGNASTPITYTVGVFNAFSGSNTDSSTPVVYDAGRPKLEIDAPLYEDQGGTTVPVANTGITPAQALVLHLHGASGKRAEVVEIPAATP
ncbi:S8 family serine peptidase [Nocardioides sp. KIGAM211]|uniref:S8 family serine peptidase n=1 Tax=Nocardioides luti TaxID=2761101 RepID=A0A7X0REA0_9ACTN|nr:S8 family serine peptidase [Nocardioides luti]MBB6626657.1 S8 family serine peptidase [Nocardioides luti]